MSAQSLLIPSATGEYSFAPTFGATGGSGAGVASITANQDTFTGAITLSAGTNVTLDSATANTIVINATGSSPVQTEITFDGVTFPVTCPAGDYTALYKGYTLQQGHTYTASFTCAYSVNTSETNAGLEFNFDNPLSGTSVGSTWSAPFGMTGATLSDGTYGTFSLTWKQFDTSTDGGIYIRPSGSGYDALISQIVAGADPRLVILDWGAL
jgi:hypothetical protein